jgi:hypothetical protein
MKKARTFLIIAIWITILPYLGFPNSWKNIFFTITGLVLVYLSYLLYKEAKPEKPKEKEVFDNFSENQNFKI